MILKATSFASILIVSTTCIAFAGEEHSATATLHPTDGNTASGVVEFTKVEKGIRIEGEVSGLTPGKHGFHIHQFGDCSSPDGKSAGGHFNPRDHKHGGPDSAEKHIGDLGNIEANAKGVAKVDVVLPFISLSGEHSVVGRGMIVHAGADDLTTQPTGAAGGRVACGVIGVSE